METVKERLKKAANLLELKKAELNKLEEEKKDIIARYKIAQPDERAAIEIEMENSVKKFQKLAEETHAISERIKQIKRSYS